MSVKPGVDAEELGKSFVFPEKRAHQSIAHEDSSCVLRLRACASDKSGAGGVWWVSSRLTSWFGSDWENVFVVRQELGEVEIVILWQFGRCQSGCSGIEVQMLKNAVDSLWAGYECNDEHSCGAGRTGEHIDIQDAPQQLRPTWSVGFGSFARFGLAADVIRRWGVGRHCYQLRSRHKWSCLGAVVQDAVIPD